MGPSASAHTTLPENSGRTELVEEIEQADLAVTLDFYSACYRDHSFISGQNLNIFFHLTGPFPKPFIPFGASFY